MGKKPGSGTGIIFHRAFFLGLKYRYLNSLMRIRDPGFGREEIRIRDPRWKKFGPGMEKIRIRDPGETSRFRNTVRLGLGWRKSFGYVPTV
jgi:hypothetical protein